MARGVGASPSQPVFLTDPATGEQPPASLPVTLGAGSKVDQGAAGTGKWLVAATLDAETVKIIGTVNMATGQVIGITGALPAGTNVLGKIDQGTAGASKWVVAATLDAETVKVIGTVNVATGQVIGLAAGTAEIGNVKNSGTFAVQAALNAETTKVIGTINIAAAQSVTANAGTGTFTVDATDRAGRLVGQVEGRAASGAAKAGNPNQVGGVFNTTQPTVLTGQAVEAQYSARGAAIVVPGVETFTVTASQATAANLLAQVSQPTAASLKAEVVGPSADNSANTTTKQATIPAKATAADPAWTEGNQVPLSTDLAGFVRSKTSSWLGSTAPTVGQKAMASSLPVVVASDQSAVATSGAETGNTGAAVPTKASYSGNRATTANPTAATDGQLVGDTADKLGRQVVILEHVRDLQVDSGAITLSTTTETTLIAAGAAGVFHDLTDLILTNTSTTAVRVDFRDATAGTVRFSVALAANGGAVICPKKAIKQTTAANNWTVQLSAAVTDIRIFAQAVKNL